MSDYQLGYTENEVLRRHDGAWLARSEESREWQEYEAWLAAGGVPDPYPMPDPAPPAPTLEDQVLYDHENRLRVIEGAPPLTLQDFIAKAGLVPS
jgi:hypothetical protein